jgi:hypothetical protein
MEPGRISAQANHSHEVLIGMDAIPAAEEESSEGIQVTRPSIPANEIGN